MVFGDGIAGVDRKLEADDKGIEETRPRSLLCDPPEPGGESVRRRHGSIHVNLEHTIANVFRTVRRDSQFDQVPQRESIDSSWRRGHQTLALFAETAEPDIWDRPHPQARVDRL